MQEKEIIKTVAQATCPNCKKDFYVQVSATAPEISEPITKEQSDENKKQLKIKVGGLHLNPKELEEFVEWVGDDEVVIMDDDIDVIYNDTKKTYGKDS